MSKKAPVTGALIIRICKITQSKPPPSFPTDKRWKMSLLIILCERCVTNFIMLAIHLNSQFDEVGSDGQLSIWPKQGMRRDEGTWEDKKQDEGTWWEERGRLPLGTVREGAVGKTLKMRAHDLKSKARSKCWLTPPLPHTHKHTHTDSLSFPFSQKRSLWDETTPHYKG